MDASAVMHGYAVAAVAERVDAEFDRRGALGGDGGARAGRRARAGQAGFSLAQDASAMRARRCPSMRPMKA
jgi:hypothetical protein